MRALAVLALILTASASAQPPTQGGSLGVIEGRQVTPGGYFVNAQPGQAITRVNVWGRVARPGVYDLGPEFDLMGVLTLAGVSSECTPMEGDPELVLRLYRAGRGTPVYEATLQSFLNTSEPPAIQYGDVIEVEYETAARVAVVGAVARPGTYEVGPSFSARDAVALAGGPDYTPLRANETRETTVRIYRGDVADGIPTYQETLATFLSGPSPDLLDGDVIEIDSVTDSGWTTRDTLTAAGVATSGVIAVVQIIRFLNTSN